MRAHRGFSVLEVLDAVDKVTNMTIDRRLEGRRAGDPAMLISDNSAILSTLDWQPRHADLDGIVRDALAWSKYLGEALHMWAARQRRCAASITGRCGAGSGSTP